jgi:hypothetical protein
MNREFNFKRVGFLLILVVLIAFTAFLLFPEFLYGSAALLFSPDHDLSPSGKSQLATALYFGLVFILAAGIVMVKANDETWRKNLVRVFLHEPLSRENSIKPSPRTIALLSTFCGLLLIVSIRMTAKYPLVFHILYEKDHGVLDLFVPFIYVVSMGLMILTIVKISRNTRWSTAKKPILIIYSFIAFVFFAYAGEETSWGQDFFHWKTPKAFSGNLESQTNFHNFLNPIFPYVYTALSLILLIVLLSVWLEWNQRWPKVSRLILPHPSMIGLSLLIAFIAIVSNQEEELLEELCAVFVFFYSLHLYRCF